MRIQHASIFTDLAALSILLFVLLYWIPLAHAEGFVPTDNPLKPQGGGVDRFVRTKPGYYSSTADAQVDFSIPYPNKWQDQPGVHFGGDQNGVEIDAGIMWDSNTETDLDGTPVKPGYQAIISGNNGTAASSSAYYWDDTVSPATWRIWRGTQKNGQYSFLYEVHTDTGAVELIVVQVGGRLADIYLSNASPSSLFTNPNANPTHIISWPDASQAYDVYKVDPANLQKITIKRVAAMNRMPGVHAEPEYDDNSYMYVNFLDFSVIKAGSTSFSSCTAADVDQTRTGFDSPGNGQVGAKDLLDAKKNPTFGSKYRVNFPYLASPCDRYIARTNDMTSTIATSGNTGLSRYANEYIEIWLRHGTNKTVNAVMHPKRP